MSSGPCVPMVLEKEDAVSDFRAFIGATNPAEADEGTIRADFADSVGENIIHGSGLNRKWTIRIQLFFAESDIVAVKGE